jgi:hypothetical protein
MEKRTKQLLIGAVIVVAAAALFWFLRMRAYSLNCDENPRSPACWHAPTRIEQQNSSN